jgi:hypothetical protein
MAPEIPESEIRRVVRERMREGVLAVVTGRIPPGDVAKGGGYCVICGFVIAAGRHECEILGLHAHERCAVIWREESDHIV